MDVGVVEPLLITLYLLQAFDPKKRMTVEEALDHPYLSAYHDPEDEPAASPLSPTYFEFDLHKDRMSKDQLKELLYEEVISFKSVINNP